LGIIGADAAGRAKAQAGQRRADGLQPRQPTRGIGREELQDPASLLGQDHRLRYRLHTGQERQAGRPGCLHEAGRAARADGELCSQPLNLLDLGSFQDRSSPHHGLGHFPGDGFEGRHGCCSAKSDLQDRQAALHQGPGKRHGIGRPLDGQHRNDRRQGCDGGDIHGQTLQPPSITLTVPVVKEASSLAR
jgi:hypothetical protein